MGAITTLHREVQEFKDASVQDCTKIMLALTSRPEDEAGELMMWVKSTNWTPEDFHTS